MNKLSDDKYTKRRYMAMKKYFSYTKNDARKLAVKMPCIIKFEGNKYVSFSNGFSIALTKEDVNDIEMYDNSKGDYFNIEKIIKYDGRKRKINLSKVIEEARSKGYKLKKSEVYGEGSHYLMYYDGAYYKIGLLEATYRIIDNGNSVEVWHQERNSIAPIVIKNDIGVCMVFPIRYNEVKDFGYNFTIIEAEIEI